MKAHWRGISACALVIISTGQVLTEAAAAADEAQVNARLIRKSACLECHKKQGNGPLFQDVAAKYKNDARARDALIETVKKGGKGNWTEVSRGVPMPPYSPRLSDAEIGRLVDWVLRH